MEISLTGTFSVSREVLEGKIAEVGHEVIDFGKKTDILIVGEKTASESKIKKAETAGVKIIQEVDAEKVIASLPKKYARLYDRGEETEEVVAVGIVDVDEVYRDFASVNADAGEWNQDDIEHFLGDFEEQKRDLCDWLKIKIGQSEEKDFWVVLRRLMIADFISWEICDHQTPKFSGKELSDMPEDEFREKVRSLKVIEFTDGSTPNDKIREEFLVSLDEEEAQKIEKVLNLGCIF